MHEYWSRRLEDFLNVLNVLIGRIETVSDDETLVGCFVTLLHKVTELHNVIKIHYKINNILSREPICSVTSYAARSAT